MKRSPAAMSMTEQLAALSDTVRLRILRILEREELAVGEVAKVVQLPQSTVSRHLKVLSETKWVVKRAEGTATLYRLHQDDLSDAARTIWVAVRDAVRHEYGATASGVVQEIEDDMQRLASVLAERREDAQAFFGRLAGQWDDVRTDLFGTKFAALGLLNLLPRTWTVADLGCGTGNAAELLAPLVQKVVAVDQSPVMLAAARKRMDAAGISNVDFVEGRMEKLPLANASVDAAVCLLVLHHVESPPGALREMRRVVKPGGVVLVVDMIEHDRASYKHAMGHRWLGFSLKGIEVMLEEARLSDARIMPLPTDTAARGPTLFVATAHRIEGRHS